MQGLLEGKIAVITGAGSGVGRAASLLFAQHGAKVLVSDVDLARAQETVALVNAAGGDALANACDVADEAAVTAMVAQAVAAWGRLDVIYNNAGMTLSNKAGAGVATLEQTETGDIDKIMAVNFMGVVHGCNAATRQFDKQAEMGQAEDGQAGGGVIVNTASIAGIIGYGGAAYGATKGAVVSLTRTLALEVAGRGIRVNSVCPAGMLTHFAGMDPEGQHAEAIRTGMGANYPMGRAIDPAECAKAALFLASDLSSALTGVNLPVDCGLSAGVMMKR
jgi:NAD(P)-dependent dehydrogenase (short-subunit alcohol dehydrogenase family)